MTPAFLAALDAIPTGTSRGRYNDQTYVVSKTDFADGKSVKLVAEALGGTDYISLNVYLTRRQALLKPCEMTAAKVIAFVTGVKIEG